MLVRGNGIEERVERRNLAIANDDYIQAGVLGWLATRTGTPVGLLHLLLPLGSVGGLGGREFACGKKCREAQKENDSFG